ncbi:MAG: phospholipase D family protein [Gammaproteobacteria bacterium]|nr:phospholipase D family protein [Gammaproteobacteria bacterium]
MFRIHPSRGALLVTALLAGCASMPAQHRPRPPAVALEHAPNAELATPFAAGQAAHPELSGYHLYSVGIDGLLLRLELIARAQSTLDLQYYIFHGDESGRIVTEALLAAARRGVRLRLLVDDGESEPGDEQLLALAGDPHVSIRFYNPFRYRGHNRIARAVEFLFGKRRLDHRMHNKLFVADGEAALIGGRNIGDQYFQVEPDSQFADDDVFVTGPMVPRLTQAFEQYWNSEFAVPAEFLTRAKQRDQAAAAQLAARHTEPVKATHADPAYPRKLAAGEPLADLLAGTSPVNWAQGELAVDDPDKWHVAAGQRAGSFMFDDVARAIRGAQREVLMITPYLIPSREELALLEERAAAERRLRVLTTSMEATNDPLAQAGYMHYRTSLLKAGVQIYELRARPQSTRGSGQSARLTRLGNFSLHAKLLVFDRSSAFVGSMNFDARSHRLNTEIGVIVHSPPLAAQIAQRFDALTSPQNAYAVSLEDGSGGLGTPHLVWSGENDGVPVRLTKEPARSAWQRLEVHALTLLPLDPEL